MRKGKGCHPIMAENNLFILSLLGQNQNKPRNFHTAKIPAREIGSGGRSGELPVKDVAN